MQRGSAPVIKGVNLQTPINQGANLGGAARLGGNMQRAFVNSHGYTISTIRPPLAPVGQAFWAWAAPIKA